MKKVVYIVGIISIGGIIACGSPEPKTESTEKEEMHEEMDHSDHDHAKMEEKSEGAELLAVPENAKVFFANLNDGDKVSSPLLIQFGVEGMEVEPAGALNEGKGHHHILIDGAPIERGGVVPADSVNIHYGGGQTEAEIELAHGKHTLTMQFADGFHQSYGEQLSTTITVEVE